MPFPPRQSTARRRTKDHKLETAQEGRFDLRSNVKLLKRLVTSEETIVFKVNFLESLKLTKC